MGHRGRPRQAQARRRATTRVGRAPPPDLGTKEVRRLRQILNGRIDLPADPLAVLYSRELIGEASYAAGRRFGALIAISRRGWNLQEASVNDLWRRMVAGTSGGVGIPVTSSSNPADDSIPSSVDQLRRRLEGMRRELWRPREGGEMYFAVLGVCVDLAWPAWLKRIVLGRSGYPGDFRLLGQVKEGLHRLAELRARSPARAMAAE
jgi:hypothetical protein